MLPVIVVTVDVSAADPKSGDQRHDFHAPIFGTNNFALFEWIARISVRNADLNWLGLR